MNSKWFREVLLLSCFVGSIRSELPTCGQGDFGYELTECDASGVRWRVAVPKEGKCGGGVPPAPVRWRNCSYQCEPGKYLDIGSQQECQSCPAGTFSLGGGVRYDSFSALPRGFQVSTQEFLSEYFSQPNGDTPDDYRHNLNCSEYGWQPFKNFLVFFPSRCLSTLALSVKLVTPGSVKFSYFYPNDDINFRFSVQTQQCVSLTASSRGSPHSSIHLTAEGKWGTSEVPLAVGQNVLTWRASGLSDRGEAVLIRSIQITGIGYTEVCTPCPSGTYSSSGSSTCTACEPNTYSGPGAAKCSDCNRETHYSGYRSSGCTLRPPCTAADYYEFHHGCDAQRQSKLEFRWIEPKICSESASGLHLPATVANIPCPPCNPGQQLVKANCSFCPAKSFSDGMADCQKCPIGTAPNRAYQFLRWTSLPPNMAVDCQEGDDGTVGPICRGLGAVWQLAGDKIETIRTGHGDILFLLNLRVPQGFANSFHSGEVSQRNPIAQVSFEFDLNCAGSCELYFVERPGGPDGPPLLLNVWNGTAKRAFYRHPVLSRRPTLFQWAFVRGRLANDADNSRVSASDQAAIHFINVSNTVDGGASTCLPCPLDSARTNCISCPPGHFLDPNSHECRQCPIGHYLNATGAATGGLSACLPCGPNLNAPDGVECAADCGRLNVSGRGYDLSGLRGFHQVKGVSLFGRDGTLYFHLFNLSLCQSAQVRCHDNLSAVFDTDGGRNVSGLLCRATGVPQADGLLYGSPAPIADRLLAVTNESRWDFLSAGDGQQQTGEDRVAADLHFFYGSSLPTAKCQKGQGAVVSLRCDPTKSPSDPPEFRLPPKCPDATCDGCQFRFLLSTKLACPICGPNDYTEIVGECLSGHQNVTQVPRPHCVWAGEQRQMTTARECSSLSNTVQLLIGAATGLTVLLCLMLVFVWKKNQRLEYKYSKLVESQGGKDLPAAESCGLNEDDTEEPDDQHDRVTFARGKKFFGRLKPDAYGRGEKDGSGESARIMADIS